MNRLAVLPGLIGLVCWLATPAHGFVDRCDTLGTVIKNSASIVVLQVDKADSSRGVVFFKKVADLKGKHGNLAPKLKLAADFTPRQPKLVLDWAEPGQTAVCFIDGSVCLICIGPFWIECSALDASWWGMTRGRPELSLAYYGTGDKLRQHVSDLLLGKEVVITTIAHGTTGSGAFFGVALRGVLQPSEHPIQRIRASLQMPAQVHQAASDPKLFVGFGVAGPEDVPRLLQLLKDREASIRAEAAGTLGQMRTKAKAALPALAQTLQDADGIVRVQAAFAQARIDLNDQLGVPALVGALADKDARVRRAAAAALRDMGPDAKAAVAALIERLTKDAEPRVRWLACEALGQIGPAAESAVPALTTALNNSALAAAAAEALGGIGPKAQAAAPTLVRLLTQVDRPLQRSFAGALARIGGPQAKAAVPVFLKDLDGDERLHYSAALYLAALGPEAKAALPELVRRAKGGDWTARYALWSIDPVGSIPYFREEMRDNADYAHWTVAAYCKIMGPERTTRAVLALVDAILDGRIGMDGLAAWVNNLVRSEYQETVPVLINTLKNQDARVRRRAAVMLGWTGPLGKDALPALETAAKDADRQVRSAAAEALKIIRK
jgi:HEAT repeat protein